MPADLPVRPMPRRYPESLRLRWSPRPELACAATAASLLMPHAEPYVVRSVRAALGGITDPDLAAATRSYLRQELAHQRQHRRFNDAVAAEVRGVARLDGWMRRTFSWLGRTRSDRFGLGFAAGFEAVAYGTARYVDRHHDALFRGADPAAVELFAWHLAEEVEHKAVAHDVLVASGGRRRDALLGGVVSLALLAWFTLLGTVLLLARERRLVDPVAWCRLVGRALGVLFEVLPGLVLAGSAGHHPDRLADPLWLRTWLAERDAGDRALARADASVGQDGRRGFRA